MASTIQREQSKLGETPHPTRTTNFPASTDAPKLCGGRSIRVAPASAADRCPGSQQG